MNPPPVPKRILIAEDIPSMSALMARTLVEQGYEVTTVHDGEECLQRLPAFKPDLLIVDIMMPKMHGAEVLRRVKADLATRQIGVIICTAKAYKPDHDQVRALGAYDILVKPFETARLVGLVQLFFTGKASQGSGAAAPAIGAIFVPPAAAGPQVRLWGTRGSIPVSGAGFIRHGGNTSCLEVIDGDEALIFDAGSGLRPLGLALARQGPRTLHLFITHTHWDHIQGFPFFAPAYIRGFKLHIYAAPGFKKDLPAVFRGQLDPDYFPVQFEDMRADIEFHLLEQAPLQLGRFKISWEYTHHPAATLAFKVETGGKSLAYVSDNEFLYGYLGSPHDIGLGTAELVPHLPLLGFVSRVDLLVGEAQYLNEEYRGKVGWGHSSVSNACALAKLAGIRRWIVTHHDPLHDDVLLDQKLTLTKNLMRALDCPIEVQHGYDGMVEFF
jgi:CheY-like chemotaxis protein